MLSRSSLFRIFLFPLKTISEITGYSLTVNTKIIFSGFLFQDDSPNIMDSISTGVNSTYKTGTWRKTFDLLNGGAKYELDAEYIENAVGDSTKSYYPYRFILYDPADNIIAKNQVDLYLAGKSTKEIMAELNIKENTLKYHNKNIYSKLGVSSRKQLVSLASIIKDHRQPC